MWTRLQTWARSLSLGEAVLFVTLALLLLVVVPAIAYVSWRAPETTDVLLLVLVVLLSTWGLAATAIGVLRRTR